MVNVMKVPRQKRAHPSPVRQRSWRWVQRLRPVRESSEGDPGVGVATLDCHLVCEERVSEFERVGRDECSRGVTMRVLILLIFIHVIKFNETNYTFVYCLLYSNLKFVGPPSLLQRFPEKDW